MKQQPEKQKNDVRKRWETEEFEDYVPNMEYDQSDG